MSDLRAAAKQALEALELLDRVMQRSPRTDAAITDLRAALTTQPSPEWWRSGLAATLMREGINKYRAREIADGYWAAYCEVDAGGAND